MKFTRVRYQNGSLNREKRTTGAGVWIFRWREKTPDGRVKRKVVLGTVEQYRSKAAAQKAVEALRVKINKEIWIPSTVEQLVSHYKEKELPNKAHSTGAVYASYIRTWIEPHWGSFHLAEVRTVAVEEWLKELPLASGSKSIGWHTFRHSFATLLKANGEDVKVVQESLRHANSRITLDVYTQGLMPTKRQAQGRVVKSLLAPSGPTPATSVAASA